MSVIEDANKNQKFLLGKAFKNFGIAGLIVPIGRFVIVFILLFPQVLEAVTLQTELTVEDLSLNLYVQLAIDLLSFSVTIFFGFKLVNKLENFIDNNAPSPPNFLKISKLIKWALILELILTFGLGVISALNISTWLSLISAIILLVVQVSIPILYILSMKELRVWSETQQYQYFGYQQSNSMQKAFNLAFIGYVILLVDRILINLSIFVLIFAFLSLLASLASYIIINSGLIKAGNEIMNSARFPTNRAQNIPLNNGYYPSSQYGQPIPRKDPIDRTNNTAPTHVQPETRSVPPQFNTCKTCGRSILATDKFCNYCGTLVKRDN